MYTSPPFVRCMRCRTLLNPAAVKYCLCCDYPVGILAYHTGADGEQRTLLSDQASPAMLPVAYHRVAHRTAPARMTPIQLLGLAGLTSLVLVGMFMTIFASICAGTITP